MKFEYLKGSEKDFEGYQECVTHIYATPSGRGVSSGGVPNLAGYSIAERRPITEPVVNQQLTTEWDGEGLPPVGVECEMQNDRGTWLPVDVIAHKDGFAFGWSYDYRMVLHSDKTEGFRPIRSPEDVARDVAIDGMAEIIEFRTGCSPRPLAKWLYDAGYRKME